ncbi:MAG: hypothetical protein MZV63_00310 [Marinilabiliales bacterium]|nr:hypothetical protein [Marinilabiliales bacterium]
MILTILKLLLSPRLSLSNGTVTPDHRHTYPQGHIISLPGGREMMHADR